MLSASWKSLLGRKLRLLMSAFAIVLGVSFVAGSLIFTDTLGNSFNGIIKGTVADLNVGPKGQYEADSMAMMRELPIATEVIEKVRQVDGVESAYGAIARPGTYLFDKDERVMAKQGPPSLGMNWFEAPAADHQVGLVLKSGRPPVREGEVAIDPASLTRSGLRLGDRMKISTGTEVGLVYATIVGTATYGTGGTAGASYAFFDDATAQKYFSEGRKEYQAIWVTVRPGKEAADVRDAVNRVLPSGLEATTGADVAEVTENMMADMLSFMSTFLLVFAGISLVVGSFLIVNTFTIIVAQRGRELALLRALGASENQVKASVLFEAFIVGLIGSGLGLAGGLGLATVIKYAFANFGLDLSESALVLSPTTVVVSLLVGIGVTMAAAYAPARTASSVPPVAAMSGELMTGESSMTRRLWIGVAFLVSGIGLLLAGLYAKTSQPMWLIGIGAVLMLLGAASSSPFLGRPVLWFLGKLYRLFFGEIGKMAELNSIRNPRRTAATASALMIGLALVTAMSILGSSATASINEGVHKNMRADYLIGSAALGEGMDPSLGDKAAEVPGVDSVHRMRMVKTGMLKGRAEYGFAAMDAGGFNQILAQHVVEGNIADWTTDTLLMSEERANTLQLRVGDEIDVDINGRAKKMKLVAIYGFESKTGPMIRTLVTLDTLTASGEKPEDMRVAVHLKPDADPVQVKQALLAVTADTPLVSVTDQAEYAKQMTGQVDQMLTLIYALLGLAVVIAILGIVNTLGLSVIERTKEIGLLRAIGLKRWQLRRMITLESVAISLLGSVLGLGLGVVFGYAVQQGLRNRGLEVLSIPWHQLGIFLLVAALVGVLAAIYPAHRAARMDVLQAISHD